MKAPRLGTADPLVELVEPDIERDPLLGVEWLSGEIGRDTLSLMGVTDRDNVPTNLENEKKRVAGFIDNESQFNWMIKYDTDIVGSIWVDLQENEGLPAPAIHIMIGDPNARGKGIGNSTTKSVIDYLHSQGKTTIYSRHLVTNERAAKLLEEQGFTDYGEAYSDQDGLKWQNMSHSTE